MFVCTIVMGWDDFALHFYRQHSFALLFLYPDTWFCKLLPYISILALLYMLLTGYIFIIVFSCTSLFLFITWPSRFCGGYADLFWLRWDGLCWDDFLFFLCFVLFLHIYFTSTLLWVLCFNICCEFLAYVLMFSLTHMLIFFFCFITCHMNTFQIIFECILFLFFCKPTHFYLFTMFCLYIFEHISFVSHFI